MKNSFVVTYTRLFLATSTAYKAMADVIDDAKREYRADPHAAALAVARIIVADKVSYPGARIIDGKRGMPSVSQPDIVIVGKDGMPKTKQQKAAKMQFDRILLKISGKSVSNREDAVVRVARSASKLNLSELKLLRKTIDQMIAAKTK